MRNPLAGGLEQDVLSIRRERFVGDGMQDSFAVQNQGMEPIEFDLELEVGTDFADIFAVKDYDFALGDPLTCKAVAVAEAERVRRGAQPVPDLRQRRPAAEDAGDLLAARRGERLEE